MAIGAIAIAVKQWLKGRAARKVQVQIGDLKIQANTAKEILQLLDKLDKAASLQGEVIKTKKKQ